MTVVTRFAPSPTWYVHIWSLRTVLYNYLFAKKNNGKFLVRIEDTDRTRLVEWSVENMLEVLASVWLIPDEWPNNPWDKWPYYQSERLNIYKNYIQELIDKDKAYYCFCSPERLTKLREEQQSLWLPTKYDKKCRFLTKIKVPSKDIDEQVLLKTDWFPTYHLANVVDDHLMWVTHVIRWDEWTPSTPKHVIMYDAFWWEKPIFAHIPLLLWTDKKKLSKRTWDVAVEKYLEHWYLTESLINYIALLWWNPKTTEEFFSMDELIKRFDLKQVHKAWAVFDTERLKFFNSHYLKTLDLEYLYNKLKNYLEKYDKDFLKRINNFWDEYNKKVLNEIRTKIKKFDEFKENTFYLYNEPKIPNKDLLINEKMKIKDIDIVKKALQIAIDITSNNDDFNSIDEVKNIFIEKIKEAEMKNWQVLWPTRVALSWEQFSIWALELIYILWTKKSTDFLTKVLKTL